MSASADDDKSFERVLASFLREDLGPSRQDCPHPGALSAYFEGKLAEPETRELEVHLSQCSACQAEVAALARWEPEPAAETERAESVGAPPLAPTEPSPEPEKIEPSAGPVFDTTRVRRKARRSPWTWLGPVALAASAVLAISVTYRFAPLIGQASRRSRESGSSTRAPEEARQLAASRDTRAEEALETPQVTLTAPATAANEAAPEMERDESGSQVRQETAEIAPVPTGAEAQTNAAPTAPASPVVSAPRAASKGAAEATQGRKYERELEQRGVLDGLQYLPGAERAPVAGPSSQRLSAAPAKAMEPATGRAVVIVAHADPDVAWRVHEASIERSDDGGKTWRAQSTGGATGLLVGSAPTATICWLAGRSGLVLRTTDGEHWKRLPPPTTSDLVEITARNASHATVRAASGERFSTRDGGQSWSNP